MVSIRQILAHCFAIISEFLRQWQSREEERHVDPNIPVFPVQYCRDTVPELFKLLWRHRHSILPLPVKDVPRWKLDSGYPPDNIVDRLECSLVYMIVVFVWAFAETR